MKQLVQPLEFLILKKIINYFYLPLIFFNFFVFIIYLNIFKENS